MLRLHRDCVVLHRFCPSRRARALGLECSLLVSRDERDGAGYVGIVVQEDLLLANLVVQVEEVGRAAAWHGVLGESAGERELVENRLVPAEEAVLLHLGAAVVLGHHVAHVEDLAVVVHISEVAVLGRARERCLHGTYNELHAVGELVGSSLAPRKSHRDGDEGDSCKAGHQVRLLSIPFIGIVTKTPLIVFLFL